MLWKPNWFSWFAIIYDITVNNRCDVCRLQCKYFCANSRCAACCCNRYTHSSLFLSVTKQSLTVVYCTLNWTYTVVFVAAVLWLVYWIFTIKIELKEFCLNSAWAWFMLLITVMSVIIFIARVVKGGSGKWEIVELTCRLRKSFLLC